MKLCTPDWAAKWALYSPHQIAIKEYETQRELSYYELNRQASNLAYLLDKNYKISKGDRIAVLANNCIEYILLFAAAQKNGMILVPLNYRLAKAEISYLIQKAKPNLCIVAEEYQSLIDNAPFWALEEMGTVCRTVFSTFLDSPTFKNVEIIESDPIFLLFTSGTTGFPKGAIYTHQMLFWNSINTAMSLIINSESRTINCMPPFHTGGWNVLLTPLLHHGGYTCLMNKFDEHVLLDLIESEKPTLFMGVPTMLKMIAEQEQFKDSDLSSLHYLIVGGEPMPIPLIEVWHQKKVFIRQGYGMTEVGPNLTSLHQRDAIRKKGSIGRPNFYVEIKIIQSNGQPVQPGRAGELLLKGPMVTPGYWEDDQATKKAFTEDWFHTGDMARQDEEGYLYIVDRIKNMYISGGENIYPAEIERILMIHPGISAAAVIAVPDPNWGEVGKAFVVKNDDFELNDRELTQFCKERLAKFKVPKHFHFIENLPLGSSGKINRKALKEISNDPS